MAPWPVKQRSGPPVFPGNEPIVEAGAVLVKAARYTRGAPVYSVTWWGKSLGEIAFDRRQGWTARQGDRQLDYWAYGDDGSLMHRRTFDTRHDAVIALRHADHGQPPPTPRPVEEPHVQNRAAL